MRIILHTTHCPACKVLETKLTSKNIHFEIDEDIEHIKDLGFMSAPVLEVGGTAMAVGDANRWVEAQ